MATEVKTPAGSVVVSYINGELIIRVPRAANNLICFEQPGKMDTLDFDLKGVEICLKAAKVEKSLPASVISSTIIGDM